MEEYTGEEILKDKRCSVMVKEVGADDASVEEISISHSLAELLIKEPFYGRSDYSDLPGVRKGISSSWRSFAEYPRRTNTFTRYQANTSVNLEQRERKNYKARINREKLTLQRQAKRERLRAEQQLRRSQQIFFSELHQSSSICNSLNPGLIISSPQKGSPTKKFSQKDHSGHGQRKVKYGGNSKTSHHDDMSHKFHNNSKDTVSYNVSNFKGDDDDRTGEYFDDVVSTTSAHGDFDTSKSSKSSLISTVSISSQGKIVFDSLQDSDDNPVTSSSHDTTETLSKKPISSDISKPSVSATCIVKSTTAPEIAVADSSTMSGPRRKTRNVKRVDYTEMLENDSDHDMEQPIFRESVNSGRKIRPVKRTLEKAIVDASLKRSPRKKKTDVEKKGNKSSPQLPSASSSNTEAEDDKIRQICDTIKQMTNAANKLSANTAHVAGKKNIAGSRRKQKKSVANAVSTEVPSQDSPVSTATIVQPHSLCLSSTSDVPLPVHSAFVSGSLSNKQQSPSSQFVTSVPQNASVNFPLVFSYEQQPYSYPLGHIATTPPSSVKYTHTLQNSTIDMINSVTQPQLQKLSPIVTAQNAIRYPVNSLQLPRASLQMHTPQQTLLTGIPTFSNNTVVYDMNHSLQPPELVLQPQTFIPALNNSVNPYQPVIRQETASSVVMQLNDPSSRAGAYQHPSTTQLNTAVRVDQQQILHAQNMMTNNLTQYSASPKYINGNNSPTTTNDRTHSEGTEVLSCKRQSQFDVESMLSSTQKSQKKWKNNNNSTDKSSRNQTDSSEIRCIQSGKNSNNERTVQSAQNTFVPPRLTSQEIPGLILKPTEVQNRPQYVTFSLISQCSSPQGHSSSGQRAFLQTSNQSLEKSHITPVGPPPLISVSDLLNSSVSVSSFGINQGGSASLTYQNNNPLTATQTKHNVSSRITLPSASQSILEKCSITGDMAAQIESSIQRSAMTAKPNSTAYFTVGSSPRQGLQPQLLHPSLQHPEAFLLSNKMKPRLSYSGIQQDQLLRMPALMSFISNPCPVEGTKQGCQTSNAPSPHFTGKLTSNSNMSQQNLTCAQRAPTGMTISQKPQVPISQESRNPSDEAMSNFLAMYRFPQTRMTSKPAVQQYNTQNQRTMVPNPRVPAPNPEMVDLREAQARDQRRPLLRPGIAQSRKNKSAARKHCQDQMLQKTSLADGSQNQTNPQSIQSRTFQQSPVHHPNNSDNAKGLVHQFSIPEDQRTLHRLSSEMAAKTLQDSSVTLPNRTSSAQIQNSNFSSSPQYTVQTGELVVSPSQPPRETSSGLPANTALYALDLSQKTPGSGHKPVTMVFTSCVKPSITATSGFTQQKPVTVVVTSRINPSVTASSRFMQQKPVTMVVTSSINPSITATSRLLQKPVSMVTSSVNPSVTATSRLLQQNPVTMVVSSCINPSVTATSRLLQQNQITMLVASSVNSPVTAVSSLSPDHSAAVSNQAPQGSYNYPLTQSQIKQESMSQYDQSENYSRHILQPDFRKNQMPAEERTTISHMSEERPMAVTSSLPSLLSFQNFQQGREFTNLQVSHSIANASTTINASPMPLTALVNNHRKESTGELINVKVEASSHAAPSAYSMSHSTLCSRAPQIPVSTYGAAEPQLSNQPGILKSSLAQGYETTATPHTDRSSYAEGQHSVPAHQPVAMKEALPAHIRIKPEIHAETKENFTSMPSSSMPSTLMPPTTTTVAKNNNTSDVVKKSLALSSDFMSTLTAASSESLPPKQPNQSSASTAGLVLSAIAGNINQHPLTSTESMLRSLTVKQTSNSQSFIPQVASHTQYVNDSVNSTNGIHMNSPPRSQNSVPYRLIKVEQSSVVKGSSCSTTENASVNSSIPECLAAMRQTMLPVCSSAITTEAATSSAGPRPSSLVSNTCDTYSHEASAKAQIAVVIPTLPSATTNEQPIINSYSSKPNPVLNDPLFVWHTDSNKQVSSFSMEDITNSQPHEFEQDLPRFCSDISGINNNFYTVTVSYPCTDNSDLHCDTEAPSVDTSVVKVEPSVERFLNPREVIDLCLSDNEENNLIDTEAASSLQTVCPNSVSSVSHHTCSSKSVDALENKTALLVMDSTEKHFSKDNLLCTPTKDYSDSVASNQHNSVEKSTASFSGISPFSVKQIIKSPLTGENVSVSGENMTFIRRRLARISSDIMSITSVVSESETTPAFVKNLSRTPSIEVADRVLCDSHICEPGQLPLHASVVGAEIYPVTSIDTAAGTSKTRKRLFNTLQVNPSRVFSPRKQTRGIEVKKEDIETISIDDDSSDDSSQQYPPSKSSEVTVSEVCYPSAFLDASSALFPMPFEASSSQKDMSSLSGSESSVLFPSHGDGSRLASIGNWTSEEVSEWLRFQKLDKICPNLKNLDGHGLQRMAFEHQRDPDMFYNRVKKTLGLTFFQTMVICRSMKELYE